MEKYTYLLINFFIIFFPFIFSFEKRLKFYKKWKHLLWSALPVSGFFIIWDIIATSRSHWSFNPVYTTGLQLINLPIEEILFFITVPYSCLFLYELAQYLCTKMFVTPYPLLSFKTRLIPKTYKQVALFLFFVTSIASWLRLLLNGKEYTSVVLLVTFVTTAILYSKKMLFDTSFWLWAGVCFNLFFVTNSILTGLSVVTYGSEFITNIRIGSIPIEDFFYNWSLLGLYVWRWQKSKNLSN